MGMRELLTRLALASLIVAFSTNVGLGQDTKRYVEATSNHLAHIHETYTEAAFVMNGFDYEAAFVTNEGFLQEEQGSGTVHIRARSIPMNNANS